MMKLRCIDAVVLATVLSSKRCHAFTFPGSSSSSLTRSSLQLRSTLVKELETSITSQSQHLLIDDSDKDQLRSYVVKTSSIDEVNTVNTQQSKSYLDDGFVFGLDPTLIRPKGKVANIVVEGDSLETTPRQVAIVSATFVGHAFFAANAIHALLSQTDDNVELTALTSIITIIASWIAADFGSGVFHWSVDNYGNGRTPIMGNIIAAFQGHHSAPWTITYRGFCNNVWKLCIPFGLPTVAAISLIAGPTNPMSEFVICDLMVFLFMHFYPYSLHSLFTYTFSLPIFYCILRH